VYACNNVYPSSEKSEPHIHNANGSWVANPSPSTRSFWKQARHQQHSHGFAKMLLSAHSTSELNSGARGSNKIRRPCDAAGPHGPMDLSDARSHKVEGIRPSLNQTLQKLICHDVLSGLGGRSGSRSFASPGLLPWAAEAFWKWVRRKFGSVDRKTMRPCHDVRHCLPSLRVAVWVHPIDLILQRHLGHLWQGTICST
jgi:hypothetical protein